MAPWAINVAEVGSRCVLVSELSVLRAPWRVCVCAQNCSSEWTSFASDAVGGDAAVDVAARVFCQRALGEGCDKRVLDRDLCLPPFSGSSSSSS